MEPVPEAGDATEGGGTGASDPEWRIGLLARLRKAADIVEAEELTGVLGAFVGPAALHGPERLVAPRPPTLEGDTEDLDLLAQPAHARADDDAAAREVIEGGQGLGEDHGVAVREHEDGGAEAHPLRDGGDEGERGQRLEEGARGRNGEHARAARVRCLLLEGQGHVVGDEDRLEAEPLRLRGHPEKILAGGERAVAGQVPAKIHDDL